MDLVSTNPFYLEDLLSDVEDISKLDPVSLVDFDTAGDSSESVDNDFDSMLKTICSSNDSESKSDTDESLPVAAPQHMKTPRRRKRKHKYRGMNSFPNIFKTDYRRNYPAMWINVINWNDAELFRSFLQYTATKTCVYANTIKQEIQPLLPLIKKFISRDMMVLHCAMKTSLAPDSMCRLNDCMIRRSKNFEGTQIVMNITHSGTVMYDLRLPGSTKPITAETLNELPSQSSVPALANPLEAIPSLGRKQLAQYRVLRPDPFAVEMTGELTILMNPNHTVAGFWFVNTHWSITSLSPPSCS